MLCSDNEGLYTSCSCVKTVLVAGLVIASQIYTLCYRRKYIHMVHSPCVPHKPQTYIDLNIKDVSGINIKQRVHWFLHAYKVYCNMLYIIVYSILVAESSISRKC